MRGAVTLFPNTPSWRGALLSIGTYPLDRRLGGPKSRSKGSGEEKNFPAPAGNRTPVVQPVASSL
jgi:hypothetical protein